MKRKTPTSYSTVFFQVLCFLQIIMLLSLAIGSVQVERYCSYLILLLGMGIFVLSFLTERFIKIEEFLLFAMFWLFLFLGVLKGWKYTEIVSVLVFSLMLTVWRSAGVVNLTPSVVKTVRIAYVLQGALLILLFFSKYAYESYQKYVAVSQELTLGFSNPNQAGIIIFCVLVVLLLLRNERQQLHKLIHLEIVGLSALLMLTKARISILGYIIFLFFYIRTKTKLPRKRSGFVKAIVWVPLFFVSFYLWLAKTRLKDVVILGKKLFSGRQRLYREVLASWTDKLFGDLTFFGLENAHNAHLTILINFGICGFLLYILYTTHSFDAFYKKCKSQRQYLCASAIMCLFFIGCAESAVLTGGSIYYVFILTYIVLGRKLEINGVEEAF